MDVDIVKILEEEVVSIHQIMKEQVKIQVPEERVEDGISQSKKKNGEVL